MKTDFAELLIKIPIFAALEEAEIKEIESVSHEKVFAANTNVFWEGDAADWFYIVIEGKVKISK